MVSVQAGLDRASGVVFEIVREQTSVWVNAEQ
jgi:hypothetical protein